MNEKFELLSGKNKVLSVLIDVAFCTASQIADNLSEFKNSDTARICLNRLENKEFLFSKHTANLSSEKVYFLNYRMFDQVCSALGELPYNENGDIFLNKAQVYTPGKISTVKLLHMVRANDFYFCLLKSCRYGNFEWKTESESVLEEDDFMYDDETKPNKTAVIRGDASFIFKDTLYIIEQDMGTTSRQRLHSKFSTYANVLEKQNILPVVLMPVYYDKKEIFARRSDSSKLSEITQIKKYVKANKEKYMEHCDIRNLNMHYAGYSIDDIRKEYTELNAKIQQDIQEGRKLTNAIQNKFRYISSLLSGNPIKCDINFINDYELKRNKCAKTEQELNMHIVNSKYENRIKLVKDVLLYNDPNNNYIDLLFLRGMDFYLGTQEEIKSVIVEHIAMFKNLNFLLENINRLLKDKNVLYDYDPKKDIMAYGSEVSVAIKYGLKLGSGNNRRIIMFEDMTYRNIGAYVRMHAIAKDFVVYDNENIVFFFLVDNVSDAKEHNVKVLGYKNSEECFFYVTRSELAAFREHKDIYQIKIIRFEDGDIRYCFIEEVLFGGDFNVYRR